jgi:hypothetical protein
MAKRILLSYSMNHAKIMKHISIIVAMTILSGCAGTGDSTLAQTLHGDRVSKESNETLCLRYLSGGSRLSNQAREVEIRKRSINCATLISPRDIEIEKRLRSAERAAEDAERAAREAETKARQIEQKARRMELCAKGMKSFCF